LVESLESRGSRNPEKLTVKQINLQSSVNGLGFRASVENHKHYIFMSVFQTAYPSDNKCSLEIEEAESSFLLCNYFY